jgi:hypothetical protein
VKLTYRQVVEVADALRSLPRAAGRVNWRQLAGEVSALVGYTVSAATVRNVAVQTRALDARRPDPGVEAKLRELQTRLDAVSEVDARTYRAIDARLKRVEEATGTAPAPKPIQSFGNRYSGLYGSKK